MEGKYSSGANLEDVQDLRLANKEVQVPEVGCFTRCSGLASY